MAISAVAAAVPSGTFPLSVYREYREQLEWQMANSEYQNGWSSRRTVADNPRRVYEMAVRLTPALAATLRAFFAARGVLVPFHLLPLREGGLRVMRFASGLSETTDMGGRIDVRFSLLEVS